MFAAKSIGPLALLWLVICAAAAALPARIVMDKIHGWRSELPESYLEAQFDRQARPDQLFAFVESTRTPTEALRVEFFLLPTERPNGVQAGSTMGSPALHWKGARIEYAVNDRANGMVVEFTILVPVRVNAICLIIWGPPNRRADAQTLAQSILDRFEAASSRATGTSSPGAANEDSPQNQAQPVPVVEQESASTIWVLVAVGCLVMGFAAGWLLRGATIAPPKVPLPLLPSKQLPEPVSAPPPAKPARSPDETDPGDLVLPKCRQCGAQVRAGKKVCMNCGSEVF